MTTYSSTVSNTLYLIGGAQSYKWDDVQWDNFSWNSSNEDLMITFFKSISNALDIDGFFKSNRYQLIHNQINFDDNLIRDLIKRFAETITADNIFSQKIYKLLSENMSVNDEIEKKIWKMLSVENCSIQDLEILYKQRGDWYEKSGDFRDLAKTWEQNWTEVN